MRVQTTQKPTYNHRTIYTTGAHSVPCATLKPQQTTHAQDGTKKRHVSVSHRSTQTSTALQLHTNMHTNTRTNNHGGQTKANKADIAQHKKKTPRTTTAAAAVKKGAAVDKGTSTTDTSAKHKATIQQLHHRISTLQEANRVAQQRVQVLEVSLAAAEGARGEMAEALGLGKDAVCIVWKWGRGMLCVVYGHGVC